MVQKTMVIDISLDHLKEDEVALILGVLERDAKIQKQEDERRRRLRESMKGERIPEKRLSVKIRTGEWMEEITAPSRAMKRRGTEIVRASIRRKVSTKQTREANLSQLENETDASERDEVVQNGDIASPQHEPEGKVEKIASEKSSLRKTSIRRKKAASPNQDKQVKFDTEKTKEFVYEQTSIDSMDGIPAAQVDVRVIPTIVVQSDEATEKDESLDVAQPVEVTVITDDAPASTDKPEQQSYNSEVFASSTTFESYHHSVGRDLYNDENQTGEDKADNEERKKEKEETPKVLKKAKVVKRKGSSRRKGKIFDDSSRDTLFNAPEENSQVNDVEKVVADKTVEAVIVSAAEELAKADAVAAVDSDVPDVSSTKRDGNEQSETVQPITSIPMDDAYPEAEKQLEDFDLMSSIMGEVAKEYGKLVGEGEKQITSVGDVEKYETHDSSEHKMLNESVFEKTFSTEKLTEQEHAVHVDDHSYSPEPKLDLGLSEVLNTITEKYNFMPTEVKETLPEIANDPQPLSFKDDIYEAQESNVLAKEKEVQSKSQEPIAQELELRGQIAALAGDSKLVDVSNDDKQVPEEQSYKQDISTPIVDNLVESVLEAAQITLKESDEEDTGEKEDGEEHKVDKPKKKVVRRVIKKKKAEKPEDEHGSPKSEAVKENDENVEGSPTNSSKFSRKKTVRKKVIRKAPPPSE